MPLTCMRCEASYCPKLPNLNTPNYMRLDVDFQSTLEKTIDNNALEFQRTYPKHLSLSVPDTGPPKSPGRPRPFNGMTGTISTWSPKWRKWRRIRCISKQYLKSLRKSGLHKVIKGQWRVLWFNLTRKGWNMDFNPVYRLKGLCFKGRRKDVNFIMQTIYYAGLGYKKTPIGKNIKVKNQAIRGNHER